MQPPNWTEFLQCCVCTNKFDTHNYIPISLTCGHTLCSKCLAKLKTQICPYDKTTIGNFVEYLPKNYSILQMSENFTDLRETRRNEIGKMGVAESDHTHYLDAMDAIDKMASFLLPLADPANPSTHLTKPMLRKLVSIVACQVLDSEGRSKMLRAARSIADRTVTELLVLHQNQQQLSTQLWTTVKNRGCQFLGPVMQEEALKLVLMVLCSGKFMARKTIVLYVVQQLLADFPQASKTSVGHVVQLLYRASCFNVEKREDDSSLMQLKEEFRTYETLRREHDAQIIRMAMEAGLRISPEHWSSLLYGNHKHKSDMQSIIDKLISQGAISSGLSELVVAIGRSQDPYNLSDSILPHLETLLKDDITNNEKCKLIADCWSDFSDYMHSLLKTLQGFSSFMQIQSGRFKTGLCPSLGRPEGCLKGDKCTYAHTTEERELYRTLSKKQPKSRTEPIKSLSGSQRLGQRSRHSGDLGPALPDLLPYLPSDQVGVVSGQMTARERFIRHGSRDGSFDSAPLSSTYPYTDTQVLLQSGIRREPPEPPVRVVPSHDYRPGLGSYPGQFQGLPGQMWYQDRAQPYYNPDRNIPSGDYTYVGPKSNPEQSDLPSYRSSEPLSKSDEIPSYPPNSSHDLSHDSHSRTSTSSGIDIPVLKPEGSLEDSDSKSELDFGMDNVKISDPSPPNQKYPLTTAVITSALSRSSSVLDSDPLDSELSVSYSDTGRSYGGYDYTSSASEPVTVNSVSSVPSASRGAEDLREKRLRLEQELRMVKAMEEQEASTPSRWSGPKQQPYMSSLHQGVGYSPHQSVIVPGNSPHNSGLLAGTIPHHSGLLPGGSPHNSGLLAGTTPHHSALLPGGSPHNSGLLAGTIPHHSGLLSGGSPHNSGLLAGAIPHHSGLLPGGSPHNSGLMTGTTPHHSGFIHGKSPHSSGVPPTQYNMPYSPHVSQYIQPPLRDYQHPGAGSGGVYYAPQHQWAGPSLHSAPLHNTPPPVRSQLGGGGLSAPPLASGGYLQQPSGYVVQPQPTAGLVLPPNRAELSQNDDSMIAAYLQALEQEKAGYSHSYTSPQPAFNHQPLPLPRQPYPGQSYKYTY